MRQRELPTIGGRVTVAVPKGASSGQVLRLRGKGVKNNRSGVRGDQLITLKIVLPAVIDSDLERLMQEWSSKRPYDPRARFREAADRTIARLAEAGTTVELSDRSIQRLQELMDSASRRRGGWFR